MKHSKKNTLLLAGIPVLLTIAYSFNPILNESVDVAAEQSENAKINVQQAVRYQRENDELNSSPAINARLMAAQKKKIFQQHAEIKRLKNQLMLLANAQSDHSDDALVEFDVPDPLEEKAVIDNHIALLDDTLAAESVDPEWGQQSSDKITEIFNSEQLQEAELVSAHCGSTLCRVEAEVEDDIAAEQFFNHFAFLIDWPGSTFAQLVETDDGQQNIVFFVSREGYALPDESV